MISGHNIIILHTSSTYDNIKSKSLISSMRSDYNLFSQVWKHTGHKEKETFWKDKAYLSHGSYFTSFPLVPAGINKLSYSSGILV